MPETVGGQPDELPVAQIPSEREMIELRAANRQVSDAVDKHIRFCDYLLFLAIGLLVFGGGVASTFTDVVGLGIILAAIPTLAAYYFFRQRARRLIAERNVLQGNLEVLEQALDMPAFTLVLPEVNPDMPISRVRTVRAAGTPIAAIVDTLRRVADALEGDDRQRKSRLN